MLWKLPVRRPPSRPRYPRLLAGIGAAAVLGACGMTDGYDPAEQQKVPPVSTSAKPSLPEPGPDAAQPGPDAALPGPDAAQPGPDAALPGPDAAQPGPDASDLMAGDWTGPEVDAGN